jgi:hypothetical protein
MTEAATWATCVSFSHSARAVRSRRSSQNHVISGRWSTCLGISHCIEDRSLVRCCMRVRRVSAMSNDIKAI